MSTVVYIKYLKTSLYENIPWSWPRCFGMWQLREPFYLEAPPPVPGAAVCWSRGGLADQGDQGDLDAEHKYNITFDRVVSVFRRMLIVLGKQVWIQNVQKKTNNRETEKVFFFFQILLCNNKGAASCQKSECAEIFRFRINSLILNEFQNEILLMKADETLSVCLYIGVHF